MLFAGAGYHGHEKHQLGKRLFSGSAWRRVSFGVVLLVCCLPTFADAQPLKALRAFDIPKQPLESAILAFADQARIQVLLWAGPTSNVNSSGVRGLLSPIDALEAILANTGLSYQQIDADTVAIFYPGPNAGGSVRYRDQPVPEGYDGSGYGPRFLVDPIRFSFNPCRRTPLCDIKR